MSRDKTNRQGSMANVVRVRSWQEFKRLAINLKPESAVYNIEQNDLSPQRDLTCLRLIMSAKNAYHIFLDFPKEEALRETCIPIRRDKKGNRYLVDNDVTSFLKTQLERKDLTVCSYWTI